MGINRRDFLTFVVGAGSGGLGALYLGNDRISEFIESQGGEYDPYHQEFNASFVSDIEFTRTGVMSITLPATHRATWLGIWHADDAYEQDYMIAHVGEMGISGGSLPKAGGTVRIQLLQAMAGSGLAFPNNRFRLAAFQGRLLAERTGSVGFRVPEDVMPAGSVEPA